MSALRKCCSALRARGGDNILLKHWAASADMQIYRSSCESGYLSHLVALVPIVGGGSTTLSYLLPVMALFEP